MFVCVCVCSCVCDASNSCTDYCAPYVSMLLQEIGNFTDRKILQETKLLVAQSKLARSETQQLLTSY